MSLITGVEVRYLISSLELLFKNVFIKLAFINLSFHLFFLQISNDMIQRQVAKTRKKTGSDYNKKIFFYIFGGALLYTSNSFWK